MTHSDRQTEELQRQVNQIYIRETGRLPSVTGGFPARPIQRQLVWRGDLTPRGWYRYMGNVWVKV